MNHNLKRLKLKALGRGHFEVSLVCPACEAEFRAIDQGLHGESIFCPQCGQAGSLEATALKETFERQMRRFSARLEDTADGRRKCGHLITTAVEVLKPMLTLVIVGQYASSIGHQIHFPTLLLARLRQATGETLNSKPIVFFTFVSDPDQVANKYIMELWSRQFIVTQAAKIAYELLADQPRQADDNSLFNFRTDYWCFGWRDETKPGLINDRVVQAGYPPGALDYEIAKMSDTFPPRRLANLIDLRDQYWASDLEGDIADYPPPWTFTADEHRRAADWLGQQGLTGRNYICFLGWDDLYYEKIADGRDYRYYDFRIVDIHTFEPAMDWLVEQGRACLRMGSLARVELESRKPGIIDYAFLPRNDLMPFLDVYLSANCLFYVSCDSGPNWIPLVMKRPLLLASHSLSNGVMLNSPHVYTACRRLREKNGRILTFREILQKRLDLIVRTRTFQRHDLTLDPLTSQEIKEYVMEMHRRVVGDWIVGDDEKELTERFFELMNEFYPGLRIKSRPLYSFLSRHRALLPDRG